MACYMITEKRSTACTAEAPAEERRKIGRRRDWAGLAMAAVTAYILIWGKSHMAQCAYKVCGKCMGYTRYRQPCRYSIRSSAKERAKKYKRSRRQETARRRGRDMKRRMTEMSAEIGI
jgi:hypothetical protein